MKTVTEQIAGKSNISVLKISNFSADRNSGIYKLDGKNFVAVRCGKNSFVLTGDYSY